MTALHIAEEILIDYADDPASVPDRAAVEAHLALCTFCRGTVEDYRRMAVAMSAEETWWATDEIDGEEGQHAIRELVARREAEDAEAKHLLRRLLEDAEAERLLRRVVDSEYRFVYRNVTSRKRLQTGGVVRLLSAEARDQVDRDPRFALVLAEAAAVIAEALPDDYYPAAAVNELRGTAWKEYSTACRYLARFENGFDALDRAERAYRRLIDPAMQLAVLDLCRAMLLWEQQRYVEALELVRAAAREFSQRRDTERFFQAKEIEALILHRQGNVAEACATHQQAFALADIIGDPEMKARSARNLAVAYRDSGDLGSAGKYLLIALQLYESLDQYAMVVHTRTYIARLSLAAGNPREAAQRIPPLVDELRRLGMSADAARAQLDLVEALLMLERFDEVHDVCTSLFAFFRNANMWTGALTAAAFLREASAKRTLTREQVDRVRTYLGELERSPDLPFAPPPEAG